MKHFDILVSQLCNEIDDLKEEITYWKSKCKSIEEQSYQDSKDRLKSSQEQLGSVLKLVFSLEDTEDGNLLIRRDKK